MFCYVFLDGHSRHKTGQRGAKSEPDGAGYWRLEFIKGRETSFSHTSKIYIHAQGNHFELPFMISPSAISSLAIRFRCSVHYLKNVASSLA